MTIAEQNADAQLPSLLRSAVCGIIDYLQKQGVEPALPRRGYFVQWMQQADESRSCVIEELHTEPVFAFQHDVEKDLWDIPEVISLVRAVGVYVAANGRFFPWHQRGADELASMIVADYFLRVGALHLDDAAIAATCATFTGDLSSSTAVVETVFQVEGFRAEEPFALTPEITFRPITKEDIDQHGRKPEYHPWFQQQHMLHEKNWICAITRPATKENNKDFLQRRVLQERIISALNLAIPGRATLTLLAERIVSPYLRFGVTSSRRSLATSRNGAEIHLTKSAIKEFQSAYEQLTTIEEQEKFSWLRLPVRRVRLASTREEPEDQLVDYVIGLERLLASDTPQLEVTFRFKLRGAALLPARFGTMRERIKLMNHLYSLRSDIVHGNATQEEVQKQLPTAEDILRVILHWYIGAMQSKKSRENILKELDEALVEGGSGWAGNASH